MLFAIMGPSILQRDSHAPSMYRAQLLSALCPLPSAHCMSPCLHAHNCSPTSAHYLSPCLMPAHNCSLTSAHYLLPCLHPLLQGPGCMALVPAVRCLSQLQDLDLNENGLTREQMTQVRRWRDVACVLADDR